MDIPEKMLVWQVTMMQRRAVIAHFIIGANFIILENFSINTFSIKALRLNQRL
jgi:hypothetical protein